MKVITFGVFDLLHYGHIRLFKRCKKYGDYLIVAVQKDSTAKLNKPDCTIVNSEKARKSLVESIKYVDEAIFYNQIDSTIKKVNVDVLVVGPDQKNDHFKKALKIAKNRNIKIVKLSRTRNISSSIIRDNYKL